MTNTLHVTFEEPGIGENGVSIDGFTNALKCIQDAMRLMVEHLGNRVPGPGRPPTWVRDQSALHLAATHPGSLVAELTLGPPPGAQGYLGNLGSQAIGALLSWDGSAHSRLPLAVTEKLCEAPSGLPESTQVFLGDAANSRKVEIERRVRAATPEQITEDALLHGWLKEVNWASGTAQLHDYSGGYVRLQFEPSLNDEMLRLATQYVDVRGRGRFDRDDAWGSVYVERVSETRSWREPFDLGAFRNNPHPKIFDPEKVITASEPFDVDHFIRAIHEGRDVRREDSAEW